MAAHDDPGIREHVGCETCGGSGRIDHEATLTGRNVHSACASACDDCAGTGEIEVPLNPEWEAKAAAFRDEDRTETDISEADITVKMLETWFPEMFPANELGQVHMARAMAESAADMIRALQAALTHQGTD